MNTYISELSGMVPVCGNISRKLDKLTVLRIAVQHMKAICGTKLQSYTEGHYKPSYISDVDLKHLILESAEGFLFVVGCDRGKLLYVSESVRHVLNYTQSELLGQSWFDILHPKDVAKVKEQLNDPAPRERLFIDIRTMLPVKGNSLQHHWGNRLCPGARRSFFCRMKCKPGIQVKKEATETERGNVEKSYTQLSQKRLGNMRERKYSVVYCTGYMKPWPKTELDDTEGDIDDSYNLSCLIAVGRTLPALKIRQAPVTCRPVSFTSRHALDGKFVFVDQKATLVLGFLPQELIGTSMYEFYHQDDIPKLAATHKTVLSSKHESISTPVYRFRICDSTYVSLASKWKAFRNPWTRDIECLVAINTLVTTERGSDGVCVEVMATTTISSQHKKSKLNKQSYTESRNFSCYESRREQEAEVVQRNQQMENVITTCCRHTEKNVESRISRYMRSMEHSQSVAQANGTDMTLHPSLLAMTEESKLIQMVTPVSMSTDSTIDCAIINNATEDEVTITDLTPVGISSTSSLQHQPSFQTLDIQELVNLNSRVQSDGSPCVGPMGPPRTLSTFLTDSNDMMYIMGEQNSVLPTEESPEPTNSGDATDDAAMAVIMSLLEAEGGLGGNTDLSGLPWSLS